MSKAAGSSGSRDSQATFDYVSQEKLRFDASNPRFGGEAKRTSQEEIQKHLESAPHLALELVDSFVENGFVPYEPLVVRKDGDEYVVIEGNRRLAAIRFILANPSKYAAAARERLQSIPVLVFQQKADASHREMIGTYLGLRHLLGYRDWPPESKAIFLDEHIKSARDLRRVTEAIGMKRQDVSRYLIPYRVKRAASEVLAEFGEIEDKKFWTLGEALQRANIKEYIKLKTDPDSFKVVSFDKAKLRHLLEFLYGSSDEGRRGSYRAVTTARITETRQLSKLARVLSSKKAAEKLEEGSTLEESELYVEAREDSIQGLISDLRIILEKIISLQPTADELTQVEEQLRGFQTALRTFSQNAKPKV
jgi:hypothetical protein